MWYVKELSRLTKVSVRTLHHYDEIGLLKPSQRLDNNYRRYSENDLLKLEQIVALKFFGFTLSHIKVLLTNNENMLPFLKAQLIMLEAEISFLKEAKKALLETAIEELEKSKSINWRKIVANIDHFTHAKGFDPIHIPTPVQRVY